VTPKPPIVLRFEGLHPKDMGKFEMHDARTGGDAAYRSAEMETTLKAMKLTSHIRRKGKRGKPLTEKAKQSNRTKSTVRVRVEHIFGAQAKAKIGMKNLAHNLRRLAQLGLINPCPA
jgi:transposase, IS5 family